jgi:hypothetical protein
MAGEAVTQYEILQLWMIADDGILLVGDDNRLKMMAFC